MGRWKECTISDIGTVVGGATPSTKSQENYDGGTIAWITPKDLSSFHGRYISRGERNITKAGLNSCSAQLLPPQTVLFSSRAPIGYVAIAENEVCTNQGFKSVIPNKDTDPLFLYYLLKYNKDKIENMGSGTTFKEVSGSTMKGVQVFVPEDTKEQEVIGRILGSLDDKLEANDRINQNLEEQAQAIFTEWFINQSSPECHQGTFGEIIESTISGDWGKDTPAGNNTEMVYCVRGADIPEVRIGNKGKMPIRYILPKNYVSKKLVDGDIVVEISGGSPTQSTGRAAIITKALLNRYDKGMVCTNFCKALKPRKGYSMFAYHYWQYLYNHNVFFSYENGTTGIKNLDINGFIEFEPIFIPPEERITRFNDICDEIYKKIYACSLESEYLASLRDILLPKLMSGELDVSALDI